MTKRRHEDIDVDELIDSMNLDKGLRAAFSELTADELAALLADFANLAKLPTAAIKKARDNLPTVKWTEFAAGHGLPLDVSYLNPVPFTSPTYRLPLSLHKTMFEDAWRWQDVYRDLGREEVRMRLLDPYIVPIVALFQGRVIDQPNHVLMETQYSTGSDVEHAIVMIGGILFCVVDCKLGIPSYNNLAQLFLALVSAAEQNKQLDFTGLRIYGLLTDLTQFKFYSYDPTTKQFCCDKEMIVNTTRVTASYDMINVSNKIFGIILMAYMDGLQAIISRRAKQNDSSASGAWIEKNAPSSQKPLELGEKKKTGGHKLTDQWEAALGLAKRCVDKFNEPVVSIQDIEARANGALELLTQSVHSIPRTSFFSGAKDPSTPTELKELAMSVIKAAHEQTPSLDVYMRLCSR